MSRKSTRKAARVSYAELLEGDQPEPAPEASSSTKRKGKRKAAAEDSDFEHADAPEEQEQDELADSEADEALPAADSDNEPQPTKPSKPKPAPKQGGRRSKEANARARPCPAYFPDPSVRLQSTSDGLFAAQRLVEEPGQRDAVSTRKSRDMLGVNVGAGPVLSMCEDLGWFKEGSGRPVVYEGVRIKDGDYTLVQSSDLGPYLESAQSSITCLMGPFGSQQPVQVKLFETRKLDEFWPTSQALAFNAGNPVWGLDWCPVSEEFGGDHEYAQYLGVSTVPSTTTDSPAPTPRKSTVQIWRFGPSKTPTDSTDLGAASCALVLCIDDLGSARVLKWCPLPAHDKEGESRKLGILAGVFGDGSIAIYAVPDPKHMRTDAEGPLYIRATRPLVRLALPDTWFTSLDWGNSEVIVAGCLNGHIAVYNVKSAIQGNPCPQGLHTLPTHYISVHQSRVQSVKWVRIPSEPGQPDLGRDEDPHMVISGGFDGQVYVTDVRHAGGMPISMYRCRDVIQSVAFSSYGGGIISNEHENIIKFTGLHPLVLGRGHNVTEAQGPVWDIATSDLHPQVAVASSDGTLTTANLLKYVRKGSTMPTFIHTVYRMDSNRQTNELRMLDMIIPRDHKDPRQQNKPRDPPKGIKMPSQEVIAERKRDGFGAWDPRIGIHSAAWQPTRLAQAGVLASGGASGLVRIDVLRELLFSLRPQEDEGAEDELDDD